ncbi:hypothetical protein FRC08_001838 [Ceratobasidium sp. 394]|nr:hypothetical protein FRC08_001838 [Ceratobasidium sp. 394]
MTAFHRHFSSKHKRNPDLPKSQPYLYKNQPSQRDLATILGHQSKDIPNNYVESDSIAAPEPPQLTPSVTLSDPSGPETLGDLDGNFSFAQDTTPDSPSEHHSAASAPPWFDQSRYNKIVNADGHTRYVHRTAGRVLRKEMTNWERLLAQRLKEHPDAPWYPFVTEADWKLGYWLATCKSSQSKIDELLGMEGVLAQPPDFSCAQNLFDRLENKMAGFGGPKWHCQRVLLEHFPDGKHEDLVLYLRDIEACLNCLVGRPDLDGEIIFAPEVIFAGDDEIQVYGEMPTGHRWHEILRNAGQNPDAALGGVLFGSDKTHLTHYSGDVKVHVLYVSLGNIKMDTRAQTSKRAWMLIAYIPICKWENTLEQVNPKTKAQKNSLPGILSRQLFHFCLEIICEPLRELNVHEVIDPLGNVRLIFYILIAYLADLEEQYMIAALDKSNCIHCTATTNDFGSPESHAVRTSESILDAIARVQDE